MHYSFIVNAVVFRPLRLLMFIRCGPLLAFYMGYVVALAADQAKVDEERDMPALRIAADDFVAALLEQLPVIGMRAAPPLLPDLFHKLGRDNGAPIIVFLEHMSHL